MHEDLERLETELSVALSGLDAREAQRTLRGGPGKWNIQQIVEHLLLTYRSTAVLVRARLEKGTPTKASPSLAQRIGQFTLITAGYFPPGQRAPEAVCPSQPASLQTGEELIRRVREEMRVMDKALAQAAAVFGDRRFASHSILGPLSANQWSRFHLVHGKHHARQIRRIGMNETRREGRG